MARARKPHPADVANANVVASAVRFEIALFLGVGRYATDTAATLAEAHSKAARLVAMHRNGRRPLIYGVTADGRSGLVTDTPNMESSMKTYAKKFNAQRAAKAAGHNLDEVDIIKAKDGFTWRVKRRRKSAADARDAKLAADPSREPPADEAKHSTAPKRPLGKRAQIEADARAGKLPAPPDFSAATQTRFRNKPASVIELAKAGDLKGLQAFQINPVSLSPKAIARYRDLCVIALEASRSSRE
ncbi:MAG TPA: hypothetical protein VFG05_10495 [Methylocella sp.]|nr:hypothetical protein [Methylocella sp.]